ncbi:type I restriction enzyme S subunit [Desulfosalsimonas propionicica]|uniref:Type I restriction enzyme S subunit n=1 Tax=Desulfosalsimonas propionicica TaxID=332175 RepID=A0A7W0C6U6_9BACT|nr:restriction endonuclease subunit S [Desulfosalsimonas propionicica]MBA2880192.1 type I restriction enzyme S subunit [Desulfosalsimonas propionicica]
MSDVLKPYPEYKDSGLPWLGRVPKHWECLPHRAIFEEVKEQGHLDEQLLSVTIGRGIIRQEDLLADSSKKDSSNLDKSKYKLVLPGDIAYNKMRAWQGAVGASKYRGIVSPAYIVQRLRGELRSEYFHYLLRTPGFAKEAERWSYGITSDQWSLRPQHFKMIYSCLPPLDEQELIVGFLSGLDRHVRRFIRNRRRLIEVLNEQKQAIINRAVTRGLDPDVPLKPSGTEWIGDIPEHWEATTLGRLVTTFKTGPFGSILHQSDYIPGGTPLVNPVHMSGGRITLDVNCAVDGATFHRLREYALIEGDIVFSRRGELGRCALVRKEEAGCLIGTGSIRARLIPNMINHDFLIAALNGWWVAEYLSLMSVGATMQSLNTGILSRLPLPLPPIEEQVQITMLIERESALVDKSIAKAQREIGLIREYRTRLIADVVTGKVDVRHLAPTPGSEDLEETVESLEPLEEDIADAVIDDEERVNGPD